MKLQYTSPTIPNWYTTAEIMQMFAWRTRAQVSAAASAHRWQRRMIGRSALYAALDVETYAMQRLRRDLAKALGWSPPGLPLVGHDEWDIPCPVDGCDQFAIEYGGRWRCAGGHQGDSDNAPPTN